MEHAGRRYAYGIAPYMDAWRDVFKREAELLKGALSSDFLYIEHVGSTAVPGLAGCATLDLAAIVADLKKIEPCIAALKAIGYEKGEIDWLHHALFFKKDTVSSHGGWQRAVDLYIFTDEHPQMTDMLEVRDFLRAHPDEAAHFEDHKKKICKKYPDDFFAYQEEKEDYMKKLTEKAEEWSGHPVVKDWPASS